MNGRGGGSHLLNERFDLRRSQDGLTVAVGEVLAQGKEAPCPHQDDLVPGHREVQLALQGVCHALKGSTAYDGLAAPHKSAQALDKAEKCPVGGAGSNCLPPNLGHPVAQPPPPEGS